MLLCCRNGHHAAIQVMKQHHQFKSVLAMLPKKKSTPLIEACKSGSIEIVDILLEHVDAAAINEQDYEGNTALYHACKEERLKVVQALLTFPKLDLNIKNKLGNTALHEAIDCRGTILQTMLAMPKLDVNVQNKVGWYSFSVCFLVIIIHF
ncbi:ankyrin repeat domain-containing protein [archaeon]|nr:MAG: ankyrin repeat domain-containing protein [archaeon]